MLDGCNFGCFVYGQSILTNALIPFWGQHPSCWIQMGCFRPPGVIYVTDSWLIFMALDCVCHLYFVILRFFAHNLFNLGPFFQWKLGFGRYTTLGTLPCIQRITLDGRRWILTTQNRYFRVFKVRCSSLTTF